MIPLLQIELNAFAVIILAIMVVSRRGDGAHALEQRLFNYALIANALTLVFDASAWVLSGAQFAGGRALFVASIYLYYLFNPLVTFACLVYCDYKIFGSVRRLRARLRFYLIPLVVSYAVFAANAFSGWFFYFAPGNVYVRGPAFLVLPFLMVAYPVWIEVLTVCRVRACKTETERDEVRKLSLYMIAPLVCLVLQVATHGIQLVWIASVISFAMIYINIQNRQIYTDELTGVSNRRQIARVFSRMAESLGGARRMYAIMIDADDFKHMNDSYGHAHGDALLIRAARILEDVCTPSGDFIARMGGDEFLILATRERGEQLGLLEAIRNAVSIHNRTASNGYVISLSCGVAEFGTGGVDTLDALLSVADGAMYRDKSERKRATDVAC